MKHSPLTRDEKRDHVSATGRALVTALLGSSSAGVHRVQSFQLRRYEHERIRRFDQPYRCSKTAVPVKSNRQHAGTGRWPLRYLFLPHWFPGLVC